MRPRPIRSSAELGGIRQAQGTDKLVEATAARLRDVVLLAEMPRYTVAARLKGIAAADADDGGLRALVVV